MTKKDLFNISHYFILTISDCIWERFFRQFCRKYFIIRLVCLCTRQNILAKCNTNLLCILEYEIISEIALYCFNHKEMTEHFVGKIPIKWVKNYRKNDTKQLLNFSGTVAFYWTELSFFFRSDKTGFKSQFLVEFLWNFREKPYFGKHFATNFKIIFINKTRLFCWAI